MDKYVGACWLSIESFAKLDARARSVMNDRLHSVDQYCKM